MAVNPVDEVRIPDPSFMDDYDFGGEFVPPPQPKTLDDKGRAHYIKFVAQAPGVSKIKLEDDKGTPLKTRDGMLKAVIEGIKLRDGGYEFRETHIGTGQYKKYKNGQPTGESRNASPALDYFHAHGLTPPSNELTTVAGYKRYFEATADRQFEVTLDWNAYDNDNKVDVASKWEDFPPEFVDASGKFCDASGEGAKATGNRQPFIERGGKKFWARANIKRYVSTVSKE